MTNLHAVDPPESDPIGAATDEALANTPPPNLEMLIRRGEKSDSHRTRAAAKRARDAVDDLRARITTEEAERQVRAEIAELEAKLAAAKQKLPGASAKPAKSRPSTLPDGLAPKEVRTWAIGAGLTCPSHGRIPKNVVNAYLDAHDQNGTR